MDISVLKEMLLSYEQANELLRYDHITGKLFWRGDRKRRRSGDEAGSISATTGRPIITIKARNYFQHRVAWLLFYKEWPSKMIDHINGDPLDNRISNLRLATSAQNGANRKGGKRRLPGNLKGASLSIREGRNTVWRSSIKINGKTKNLGSYSTEMEAHQAYLSAAKAAFGEFSRAA